MTAAAYIRRSRKERQGETHSIEIQETVCRRMVEAKEWPVPLKSYIDDGGKGDEILREGLINMLLDIQRGKVTHVASYALDRLSRDDLITSLLMYFFIERGVKIYLDDIPLSDDPGFLITIIGAIASKELKTTRRRIGGGLERAIRKKHKVGRPPAGFTTSKDKKKHVLTRSGKKVAALMGVGKSAEKIAKATKLPLRNVRRMMTRIEAFQTDKAKFRRLLAEATKGAREREAFWEAVRVEERKLIKKFLIDPETHEAEVRAALAKTKERKRRFGHPNRKVRRA